MSTEFLFGKKKKLSLNNTPGTIFEDSNNSCIPIIESLRHELVHNGAWDLFPKIYCEFKEGIPKRKYIYWPDFKEGHLACSYNRKRFFSSSYTANEALVAIHLEFLNRLILTVDCLYAKYSSKLPKRTFKEATGFSFEESMKQIKEYYDGFKKQ